MITTLALLILTPLLLAPTPTQHTHRTKIQTQSTHPPSIQHFGFSIVDAYHDDPHDTANIANYAHEVAPFSTFADIAIIDHTTSITGRLDQLTALDLKAWVHLQPILFDYQQDQSSPSGFRASLRPDAEDRLQTFISTNDLHSRTNQILTLYLIDEPVWNQLPNQDLAVASQLVEQYLPDIPTSIIEAYPAIDDFQIPPSLDWVGFDHYAVADPSTDPQWQSELDLLISKRSSPHQQIIIVMETQWLPIYQTFGFPPEAMQLVAQNYYRAARQCQHTTAIIGYTWPGGFEDPQQLGARNLPLPVQQTYQAIGHQIKYPK